MSPIKRCYLLIHYPLLDKPTEISMTTKEGSTLPPGTRGTNAIMDHRRRRHGRAHQAAVAVTVESFHSVPVTMGTPKVTVYPEVLLPASVLLFGPKVPEGLVVQAVGIAWYEIIAQLDQDPEFLARMSWRNFEEIIAGGYERAGYRVTLTPPSNDGGRDVIAERDDIGKIRIYDQVKRYAPGKPVPANDVRALLGVLTADPNVSKGVLSTTSTFAPGVMNDTNIMRFVPYHLDLREGPEVNRWLMELAKRK